MCFPGPGVLGVPIPMMSEALGGGRSRTWLMKYSFLQMPSALASEPWGGPGHSISRFLPGAPAPSPGNKACGHWRNLCWGSASSQYLRVVDSSLTDSWKRKGAWNIPASPLHGCHSLMSLWWWRVSPRPGSLPGWLRPLGVRQCCLPAALRSILSALVLPPTPSGGPEAGQRLVRV